MEPVRESWRFVGPKRPLVRLYKLGDLHFITFSCWRREPLLGSFGARDCFVEVLDVVRTRHRFGLFGYVVMPEHVHLLIGEPEEVTPSVAVQVLKQKVSAEYRNRQGNREFWQRRFYDFNVWGSEKFEEKLKYIHGNPVRRGLVNDLRNWPWSSWTYYEGMNSGRIAIDSVDDPRFQRQRQSRKSEQEQSQIPHP
jgi:putative transposase